MLVPEHICRKVAEALSKQSFFNFTFKWDFRESIKIYYDKYPNLNSSIHRIRFCH